MPNKNSTIYRGALFSLFSFFSRGLNFILILVIAKFLPPDDYGTLSLFTTVLTLFGYIICLGSEGYMSVAYFKTNNDMFKRVLSIICLIPLIILLILSCILYIISCFTPSFLGLGIMDISWALLFSFFNIYVFLYLDYYRITDKINNYGLVSCSNAFLNFVITLGLIIFFKYGWYGRVYAMGITSALFALFAICFFYKKSLLTVNGLTSTEFKDIVKWGGPLIPHHASIWIKQGCDRYIIESYFSTYSVGIFSFALNLSSILTMIGVAFNSSNSVDIYKSLSQNELVAIDVMRSYLKRMLWLYLIILLLILLLVIVFVPLILPEYVSSLNYCYLLLPCSYLQCVYFLYCNYLFYYGKNSLIMTITFSSAIIHLLLSLLLTQYSLMFTSLIYIISQLIITIFIRISVSKVLKNVIPNYKPNIIL